MVRKGKWASLVMLAVTIVATPAQACWTDVEEEAAKVANLNMMMMVSALRCRKGQDDFLTEYNHFVSHNNKAIGAQNATVRARFARVVGHRSADAAMDKFVIGLANSYGGGHERLECAQLKQIATNLARHGHNATSLLAIAEDHVTDFPLSGGQCSVTIASK